MHRPRDAGHLVGHGDDPLVEAAPIDGRLEPTRSRIGLGGEAQRNGAGAVHQLAMQVMVGTFGDAAERRLAAGRILSWDDEADPGGEWASQAKVARISDRRNGHRRCH